MFRDRFIGECRDHRKLEAEFTGSRVVWTGHVIVIDAVVTCTSVSRHQLVTWPLPQSQGFQRKQQDQRNRRESVFGTLARTSA